MKACIPIAALFAILVMGCQKEPIPEYRFVYYPNKKNVKEEWSIIRTPRGDTMEQGIHKQYYWDGGTAQSEIWKQGKRDGSAQAWYEGGQVKWQKTYAAGKREKTWRLFRKDGKPWLVITYENDAMHGPVQVWGEENMTPPDGSAGDGPSEEAVFSKGNCVSGECALLEFEVAAADTGAAFLEFQRNSLIVAGFMNY